MRTDDASGTVLHRLIQEQLRYGNPTDARTLLAIQQQALRRGGGGVATPQSSSESLSQDEPQSPQLSARQEPQGQEHQTDFQHAENYQLYCRHLEQLPTYEQAKAQSTFLASQWCQVDQDEKCDSKLGHARSLSERLMQLSLQRTSGAETPAIVSSRSYPQIDRYRANQHAPQSEDGRHLLPEYPSSSHEARATLLSQVQEYERFYVSPPPPFHSQHNRILPPIQTPEARHVFSSAPPAGREALTSNYSQMELLMKENERLRQELESHAEKSLRIQKLEQEIQRISEAYDTLMQGCVKREALEQALRNRLVAEVKRLQDVNTDLRENLENTNIRAAKDVEAADHHQHVTAKLLVQKEELQLQCARLEREVQLQRTQSEEQRRRADALEQTLGSAQNRSRQLQAELRRKIAYVERVERLQGALAQLQATCEKREGLELRLRNRLEQELRSLRNQQRQSPASVPSSPAGTSALLERLREREERILALEADMTRWEQKYLEESTMREFAMEAAATAAAQRDTTIIKHSPCHSTKNSFSEDLPDAELQNQEVENRIRALYGQILEKDAVISVLQQRLQQEQERSEVEEGGVSSASSSPSSGLSPARGKAHGNTEEQTSHLSCAAAAVCPGRSQTESDLAHDTDAEQSSRIADSAPQQLNRAVDMFRGLDSVEPESVEIFI